MPVSNRVKQNMERASWIRKMFEEGVSLKEKFGQDRVYDFSLGNPDTEPPEEFFAELEGLVKARAKGAHRYMPNTGFKEVRDSVAGELADETGLPFTADHVVMTCGAAGGMNVAIKTIADPGDEIIILAPYFAEYLFYADNHGVAPVIVETDDNFDPDMDAIRKAFTEKTRAVIINSPNNPTGRVYAEAALKGLNDLLLEKEKVYGRPIYVVSDDPYTKLVYDEQKAPRAFAFVKNCIGVTSHSKDLSIPGERIGCLAVSPHCDDVKGLIDGAVFCNRTLGFVNAPALAQRAVTRLQTLCVNVRDYQAKRDFLYNALTQIGYEVMKPGGAFYLFPKSPIPDDVSFVKALQEKRILTVPGTGFGRPGYFRIAYCVAFETIEKSVEGFREAFGEAKG